MDIKSLVMLLTQMPFEENLTSIVKNKNHADKLQTVRNYIGDSLSESQDQELRSKTVSSIVDMIISAATSGDTSTLKSIAYQLIEGHTNEDLQLELVNSGDSV